MRLKFAIAVLGLALLVVGAALSLKQYLGGRTAGGGSVGSVPPVHSNVAATAAPPLKPEPALPPVAPPPTNTVASLSNSVTAQQSAAIPKPSQDAINTEIDRLQDLSLNNDPASLSNILKDLTYPDQEVREAAIEATKQFGSSDAVPVLRDLAAKDQNPEESAALLDAAAFLSLPPLEFGSGPKNLTPEQKQQVEQLRAERLAREKAWQESRAQNQNSQSAAPPANGQNPPAAPNN